jgi:hypothetical protein
MPAPTKIARKTVPQKTAPKAPAQPAQSANEREIRSALASANSPEERSALLAVVARSSEIMARTIEIMGETNQIMAKLGHLATLKRGLISLSKSMGKI